MAQSSLRQFYAVRKRPQEEHGSLKRRKLTDETRLDIPTVGKGADPQSIPLAQPTIVTTDTSSISKSSRTGTKRSSKAKTARGRGRSTRSQRRQKSPPLPVTSSSSSSSSSKQLLFSDILPPSSFSSTSTTTVPNSTKSVTNVTSYLSISDKELSNDVVPSSSSVISTNESGALPSQPSSDIATVSSSSPTKVSSSSTKTKVPKTKSLCGSEDPLLLPSSPKSPKRDTSSTSTTQPRNPIKEVSSSFTLTPAPPRSRKNLAERMKLASADPLPFSTTTSSSSSSSVSVPPKLDTASSGLSKPTARELAKKTAVETFSSSSSSSTISTQTQTRKTASKPGSKVSARELVEKTPVERKSQRLRELAQPVVGDRGSQPRTIRTSVQSTSSSPEEISRLYKLSARELAQRTEPEKRRGVAVRSRRHRGKSPAPPTGHTPQLQQFGSFVVESPTKSPAKSPNKQHAYQRFHSLVQKPGETPDLPLPYKYQVLLEKFRCTDTVVTMLQKRLEICTFSKLKQAVEEMTRRKYENRNLGQMETVYPKAFIFRQEKNIPGVYDRKTYESYQLTVECNTREDGEVERRGEEDEKEEEDKKEKRNAFLDSSALLRRRKVFNKNLCAITRHHHKEFLSSLNPPLDIPENKILRWHPAFQLDAIPDVKEADLPKSPSTEIYTTARDVLAAAQGRLAPRVQQALEGVAKSTSEEKGVEPVRREEPDVSSGPLDPALQGVSQKLLEKIQRKEACRVKSDITRDPVKEKRLEMLTRLPQLTRILRSLFVTEKKAAIPWDTVVQKLNDSHSTCLPPDGVEEHLELMKETLGGWLTVVEVRKRKFVKINKNTDSQVLTSHVENTRRTLLAS